MSNACTTVCCASTWPTGNQKIPPFPPWVWSLLEMFTELRITVCLLLHCLSSKGPNLGTDWWKRLKENEFLLRSLSTWAPRVTKSLASRLFTQCVSYRTEQDDPGKVCWNLTYLLPHWGWKHTSENFQDSLLSDFTMSYSIAQYV